MKVTKMLHICHNQEIMYKTIFISNNTIESRKLCLQTFQGYSVRQKKYVFISFIMWLFASKNGNNKIAGKTLTHLEGGKRMKRKMAFLLASVMLISMLPVKIYASSSNSLTKSPLIVGDKTAFVEQGLLGTAGIAGTTGTTATTVNLSNTVVEIDGNSDIDYIVDGTSLQIAPNNAITAGSTFKLELDNARWFFQDSARNKFFGTVTGAALREVESALGTTLTTSQRTVGSADNAFGLVNPYRTDISTTVAGNVYTRYASGYPKGTAADADNILYYMTVSGADTRVATVVFPNEITLGPVATGSSIEPLSIPDPEAPTGRFWIPIIARSTGEGDVRVTITDNSSSTISGGSWIFGTTSATMTTTYVDDPQSARDEFPINRLVIKEMRVGSMGSGTVEISAPSGYEFPQDALSNIEIIAENFGWGVTHRMTSADYSIDFKSTRGAYDYSTIVLTFKNLSSYKSSRITGIIYIKDASVTADNANSVTNRFRLIADENAAWGDINMRIRNVSGSDVVTNETFLAGVRKDWTINVKTLNAIPTLVSGRYNEDDPLFANDDDHLAATVRFEENTVNAWWAARSTVFTLPEDVKIRKIEITDTDNIVQGTTIESPTTYSGYYMNTGRRENYVTINGNSFTIGNLQIAANKKAAMELKLWLSVASGYEGDITLDVSGSAISGDRLEPIVIAKAVNPITVTSSITDVRVGYQYYPVADVTISETAAGMLERNKEVWLSVTDLTHMDMYFTPGFNYEVTEGNIKIKDVGIASGGRITVTGNKISNIGNLNLGSGTIKFNVDGISSTASTIRFSNLQLKVDRSVPESNKAAYAIYAWGPNIAPNSDVFVYEDVPTAYRGRDQHTSLGLAVPYVKVVTSATNNLLNSVVRVTAGSNTAYVNDEAVTVSPAPFIDVNTSRMQVPVRALVTLLGVPEEQIIWSDSDRTVTLNMSNRTIQFTIGSDVMLVNGAAVRMDTSAMIVDGRTFIPFRYMGDALGINVTYNDATRSATYNESLNGLTDTAADTTGTTGTNTGATAGTASEATNGASS